MFQKICQPDLDLEKIEVPKEGPLVYEFEVEVRPQRQSTGVVRPDVEIAQVTETRFQIAIQDNGPGVSEEMVPHLFEPLVSSTAHATRSSDGIPCRRAAA